MKYDIDIFDDKKRKPIKASVKKEVYERANRRCECAKCKTPTLKLAMGEGDFHHWRSPSISPTAKTVQFLCTLCHRKYGLERKTVIHNKGTPLEEKEIVIKRVKVPTVSKKKTPTKKKTTTKKKTPTKKKATTKKKRK